jgi:hypothetical protein
MVKIGQRCAHSSVFGLGVIKRASVFSSSMAFGNSAASATLKQHRQLGLGGRRLTDGLIAPLASPCTPHVPLHRSPQHLLSYPFFSYIRELITSLTPVAPPASLMAALGVARVQLLAGPRAPRSKLSTRICAAKETRSFREGDEEAVVTKPTTTENAPLYADEAKVAVRYAFCVNFSRCGRHWGLAGPCHPCGYAPFMKATHSMP